MFGLRFQANVGEKNDERVLAIIQGFQFVVLGLNETHADINTSPFGQLYQYAVFMRFLDVEALTSYQHGAAHTSFLDWALSLVEGIDLDLIVPDLLTLLTAL